MASTVCVNPGSVSRFAGSTHSSVKYLLLWIALRYNMNEMETGKFVAAHYKDGLILLSKLGLGL